MEDNLKWNTTFDGRRSLMEDYLRWKTTFDGKQPSMDDDLRWRINFDGRRHLMEDNLHWKNTSYREISRFRSGHFLAFVSLPQEMEMLSGENQFVLL